MSGKCVSETLEKMVVLIATLSSLLAIIELGTFIPSLFISEGDVFSGWMPAVYAYPIGFLLFIFIVLVILPQPIPRNKNKNGFIHDSTDE